MTNTSVLPPRHHPASFRDPSGFVYAARGNYYRQVNRSYAEDYDLLMSSGLYQKLTDKQLLIPHTEVGDEPEPFPDLYRTLLPRQLSFISYPYEWSFDQLKDAALLTLRILKIAVSYGMILKDATPYNVQFQGSSPVFIDTLSFEKYDPDKPWIAYRQFCECFLYPLLLEHYAHIDAQRLLSVYLDGIPAKTVATLLPARCRFKLGIWLHVYLQLAVSNRANTRSNRKETTATHFSKEKMLRLIGHLRSIIKDLHINAGTKSTWNNYYAETILSQNYLKEKEKVFRSFLDDIQPGSLLDIGCNDGYFSLIGAEKSSRVMAADFDSQCINRLYLSLKETPDKNVTPLIIDLSNPSPAIGFRNAERQSFAERSAADTVIALALIHHLVLSKNIPLPDVARQLSELTKNQLIIEFVPLEDEKSKQLIAQKTVYHLPYDVQAFEHHFSPWFEIEKRQIIPGTERVLYRLKKRLKNG